MLNMNVMEIEGEKMSLSSVDIEILMMAENDEGVAQHEIRESARVPGVSDPGQSSYRAKKLSDMGLVSITESERVTGGSPPKILKTTQKGESVIRKIESETNTNIDKIKEDIKQIRRNQIKLAKDMVKIARETGVDIGDQ